MRVMTSTVGGNLTNRPPALRHIHVKMILNLHVLFRLNEYFSMMSACHAINSAELQDGKRKMNCKGPNKSGRGLICGTVPAIVRTD